MKRICSLILAFSLLMNAALVVNGEEQDFSQAEQIQGLLTGIGAIDTGTVYKFGDPMTRGGFVNFVTDVLNMNQGDYTVQYFQDVQPSSQYFTATSVLRQMGALTPDENGNFNPDRVIVYQEAVKILVDILGYQNMITAQQKYPAGYLEMASRLHLNRNMSNYGELTAADAFVLMYNALDADVAKVYAIGDDIHSAIEEGYTLLNDRLHIEKAVGKVESNSVTGLTNAAAGVKNFVTIDGQQMRTAINIDSYLGYRVEYYYTIEAGSENEIIYVVPHSSNQAVTFLAEDIISFENMEYKVAGKDDSKPKEYQLNRAVDFIYNGVAYAGHGLEDFVPTSGSITLLDSENDGEYETVFVNAVVEYVVDGVTTEGVIYDMLGKAPLDLQDNLENVTIWKDGASISYTQLSQYDVLMVSESKNESGNKQTVIQVGTSVVSGFVTAFENDEVVIDNTNYELSPYLTQAKSNPSVDLPDMKLSEGVDAYLNSSGHIVYYTVRGAESEYYGIMTNADYRKGIMEEVKIRVFDENGNWNTLALKDEITLDGRKNVPCGEAYSIITNNGASKDKVRVIRYSMTKDNVVNMIDTETLTELEDKDTSLTASDINSGNSQWTYKRSSRTFEGFYSVDNNAHVFYVPGDGFEDDESLYQAGNAGYFTEGGKYVTQPYNLTDANVSNVIIVRGQGLNSKISSEYGLFVIEKISTVLEDEEEKLKLTGMNNGEEVSMVFKDADIELTDRTDMDKRKSPDVLNVGDVVRAQQDELGRITDMERLIDMSKFEQDFTKGVGNSYFNDGGYRDGYVLRGGIVYAKQDDIIAVTDSVDQDLDDPALSDHLITYSTQPMAVTVYNISRKEAEAGTTADIIPYTQSGDAAVSFAYIRSTSGDPKEIIVFQR